MAILVWLLLAVVLGNDLIELALIVLWWFIVWFCFVLTVICVTLSVCWLFTLWLFGWFVSCDIGCLTSGCLCWLVGLFVCVFTFEFVLALFKGIYCFVSILNCLVFGNRLVGFTYLGGVVVCVLEYCGAFRLLSCI